VAGWTKEFKRWSPQSPVQMYHGSRDERETLRKEWLKPGSRDFPVIITSFEIAMNDAKKLKTFNWKWMVVDEGHRLKNLNCKLILTLKEYTVDNRLLLTGTPLQNNLTELWSLLNFLLPTVFDDLDRFNQWFDFDEKMIEHKEGQKVLIEQERQHSVISKLHSILRPFVLRRIKVNVLKGLPSKKEYVINTPLCPVQRAMYGSVLDGTIGEVLGSKRGSLNNILMQLRKVCNHPFLLQEPVHLSDHTDERIVSSCGKMLLLDKVLKKLKKSGNKVSI